MENNSTTNKLEDKVKNVLSNYNADFEDTNWAKMESKLNAASSSQKINSKYIIFTLLAIATIGGGYFIFKSINSNTTNPIETVTPEIKTEEVVVPPVVKEEIIVPSVIDSSSIKTEDTIQENNSTPEVEESVIVEKEIAKEKTKTDKTTSPPKESSGTKIIADKNKTKKGDKKKNKSQDDDDGIKPEKVYTMGNEPIFGDMLDSSRGIIGRTKESVETRKVAQSKSDVPVGWDKFMLKNVNVDSLRKYRNQKDSIK